ncbi:MAG: family 43 glycosylhydrolase [Clostridia bacterium]|nr:family 43 glycosylhydrolase [Clostridia bacterium]
MKYKGTYFNMWDAWYLNVNDNIHAFHLKSHPGENWNVGHIYTKDLLHFTKMRDILETLPEEQYPDDCLGKYTGCAVEKDGIYYLYYTMRDHFGSEKIGLAISKDLEHFSEYENNPILDLDKELFVVREKGQKTDCRDMFVIYDDERKKYFGYFAAMANIKDRGELGVIGVAESTDLINWHKQKIIYIPEFNGVIEVPNVFKIDGKWYMTFMTNTQYGAKGAVSDPNLNSYIIATFSSSPNGIFQCCDDNVFLGSTRINNGYALRCVEYKNKLYAMYIERSEYGYALSLPKEVKAIDGVIKPYYTDILNGLRTKNQWDNPDFVRIPATFAWRNVTAGEINKNDKYIEVTGYKNSLQAFKASIDSVKSLEVEFNISGDFEEAGLVLYCSDNKIEEIYKTENLGCLAWADYVWSANYISFDKINNLISFNKGMVEPINTRQFPFANNNKLNVRVIAMEGQLEVYINDILFIECGMETKSHIVPGLFSYSGKARISNFKVYELEN